jgi:tetratricopeptide (TPR) repeat protein
LHAAETEQKKSFRARIYFDLAMMFAKLNVHDKGDKYLMLAIDSNPNDHIAYARLGRTYSFQNEWEKAEHYFQRSLQLKPDDRKTQQWYANMQRARERYR